jgi:hypothetical protein
LPACSAFIAHSLRAIARQLQTTSTSDQPNRVSASHPNTLAQTSSNGAALSLR